MLAFLVLQFIKPRSFIKADESGHLTPSYLGLTAGLGQVPVFYD
jgi:hypothetical protein